MTGWGWALAGVAVAAFVVLAAIALRLRREHRALSEAARAQADEHGRRIEDLQQRIDSRESALNALGDGIVLFTARGNVVSSNPAARLLLGRNFGRASEVTPPALRDAIERASGGRERVEAEVETAGRILQALAAPAGDGVVLVLRDITAARRIDSVRRDFVANASHELKTPVASIVALVETLRDAAASDPEAGPRFLEHLEGEAVRLSRLVNDLLDLSRLEGELPEREPVPLHEVVAEECERLRGRAEAAGLRLILDARADAWVQGSRSDLGLLANNLLDNAIRHSPDGGEVRAAVETRDGTVELRVSDTGLGIPSRDLDRIFERFYRVDPGRSRTSGGTGLGLSIVKHVAETHGGEVEVRSVLGAGSTFVVRLPLLATEAADP